MKYSQAIVLAIAGSAALVSALPAGEKHTHATPKKSASKKPAGKASKVGTGIGTALNVGAKFASGMSEASGESSYGMYKRAHGGIKSIVHAASAAKKISKSAVHKAGGASQAAEKAGKIAGAVQNYRAQSAASSQPAGQDGAAVTRDFDENAELAMRDFEEELYARDVEEELYARDIEEGLYSRDVEEELYSRDVEEELYARDVEEELYSREFEDDLEARGTISNAWHAIKDTIKGKKAVAATDASGSPNDAVARDFVDEDELAMRDFFEELDARDFNIDELD